MWAWGRGLAAALAETRERKREWRRSSRRLLLAPRSAPAAHRTSPGGATQRLQHRCRGAGERARGGWALREARARGPSKNEGKRALWATVCCWRALRSGVVGRCDRTVPPPARDRGEKEANSLGPGFAGRAAAPMAARAGRPARIATARARTLAASGRPAPRRRRIPRTQLPLFFPAAVRALCRLPSAPPAARGAPRCRRRIPAADVAAGAARRQPPPPPAGRRRLAHGRRRR